MPTISVIVPVYKVEKYIHRCVDSILGQSYTDFELILVDDGSPDNCGAICDEYAAKDSRVVVIHQNNGGLSAARNAGLDWVFANSDSRWISFVDSDDWVHLEYLERLLGAAEKNDADLAFCTLTAFIEDEEGYREVEFWKKPACGVREGRDILREAGLQKDGRLSGHHVIACNKLYKRKLFENLHFPLNQVHEDEAIAHRVLGASQKVVGTSEALYFYRQHAQSIMHVQDGCFRNLCIALAYGDRICYYKEHGIDISDALFYPYWAILIRYFNHVGSPKCKKLINRAKKQMRQVLRYYCGTGALPIRKIGVLLFCRMPRLISCLFAFTVKVRGG